jgi:hypothetical protein
MAGGNCNRLRTLVTGKSVEISDCARIKYNYELCLEVVNKTNIQSKTPSGVTHTSDNFVFSKRYNSVRCNSSLMAVM